MMSHLRVCRKSVVPVSVSMLLIQKSIKIGQRYNVSANSPIFCGANV